MKNQKIKTISLLTMSTILLSTCVVSVISCSNSNNDRNQEQHTQDQLNENGGSINNLQVDSYLEIVKAIDLKSTDQIEKYSDSNLNQKLHENKKLKDLNLKILSGSNTKNGILKLNLNGPFNGKNINKEIIITGFDRIEISSFEVANLKLNEDNYFNLHLPIIESNDQTFTKDLNSLKTIIKEANFIFKNKTQLDWNKINQQYEVVNISINKTNTNNLNFTFTLNALINTYDGSQWVQNKQEIHQESNKIVSVKQPSLKSLKEFMLNKLILNETRISKYYPSFYKALFNLSKLLKADRTLLIKNIKNIDEVFNKYKPIYFPNREFNVITNFRDESSLRADDGKGELDFSIYLLDSNNENDFSITRSFSTNKMKKLSELLDNQKLIVNNISIKNQDTSNLANQIKKVYKTEIGNLFNKNQLNQSVNLEPSKIINLLISNWSLVFNEQNDINKNAELANKINQSYTLSIFNNSIWEDNFNDLQGNISSQTRDSVFDYSTGIFSQNSNQENAFMLNSLSYDFNNFSIIAKTEDNPNLVSVVIKTKMIIGVNSSINQTFEQDCSMTLNITKSSWNA